MFLTDASDISGVHEGLQLILNTESYDYSSAGATFSGFKVGEILEYLQASH